MGAVLSTSLGRVPDKPISVRLFCAAGELASRLQEASVKIISRSICNKLYDDAVTPRMLCAGNLQGGVDACQVSVCTSTPGSKTGPFLTAVNAF